MAILVIVSHSFPIGGFGGDPALGDMSLGLLAVGAFFTISGYLITLSRYRTPFGTFVWRRFLRIFPGYWACLIFTAFVAAGIAGAVRGGWSVSTAINFVLTNAPMMYGGDLTVGETLAGSPFPAAWNGSLWTLRYEVACYLLTGVALYVGAIRRQRWVYLAGFVAATALSLTVQTQGIGGVIQPFSLLLPFFLAGALLFRYGRRIPLTGSWAAAAALALIAVSAAGYGESLAPLPLAYAVIWLGVALPKAVRRLGSRNDFSYGMYLYAFPVQQILVLSGAHQLGVSAYILLNIAVTSVLAIVSWFAVEQPAQRLKNWRPLTRPTASRRSVAGTPQS